jgi:hypothetical protein
MDSDSRRFRRNFYAGLLAELRVVWPILSGILAAIVGLGLLAGILEGWTIEESVYFAFVSGLTIGYGDLAPVTLFARVIAVLIGLCGVLLTALLAAIAVRALASVREAGRR